MQVIWWFIRPSALSIGWLKAFCVCTDFIVPHIVSWSHLIIFNCWTSISLFISDRQNYIYPYIHYLCEFGSKDQYFGLANCILDYSTMVTINAIHNFFTQKTWYLFNLFRPNMSYKYLCALENKLMLTLDTRITNNNSTFYYI